MHHKPASTASAQENREGRSCSKCRVSYFLLLFIYLSARVLFHVAERPLCLRKLSHYFWVYSSRLPVLTNSVYTVIHDHLRNRMILFWKKKKPPLPFATFESFPVPEPAVRCWVVDYISQALGRSAGPRGLLQYIHDCHLPLRASPVMWSSRWPFFSYMVPQSCLRVGGSKVTHVRVDVCSGGSEFLWGQSMEEQNRILKKYPCFSSVRISVWDYLWTFHPPCCDHIMRGFCHATPCPPAAPTLWDALESFPHPISHLSHQHLLLSAPLGSPQPLHPLLSSDPGSPSFWHSPQWSFFGDCLANVYLPCESHKTQAFAHN
jgi:hypothetical protein